MSSLPDHAALKTIFHECRQCGTCCKKYRKIVLQADEVDFIKKMGGHVGFDVHLSEFHKKSLDELIEEASVKGKVYMIHPDDKGCVFLEKRNDKFYCKIYHHRPKTCQGFRCNMADDSFLSLFGQDSIFLLRQNRFGIAWDDS